METLRDLIEEAKVRFVWWSICIFAICYFLSHTSKSMWMNVPISLLIALGLRIIMNDLEFRRKVPIRKQTYLSYLEKKQLSPNDSRISTAPPTQKWKKKIDSPVIQAAAEEFIDLILRDFVTDLWYTDITPDREAPQLMRTVILDALGEVAGRVKEVNLVDLLTRDMIDLVGDHLELYRRNQTNIGVDVMGTLSSEERDERLKHYLMDSKELHPALVSPECEYKFLKQLMGGVLAVVLRQREAQCPLVRTIARELLTCLVIQPVLNLASPVYINELIEFIILNFDDVLKPDGAPKEASNRSSNSSKVCTVAAGTLSHGQASSRKDNDILKVKSNRSTEKSSNRTNKSTEGSPDSSLSASHGEIPHLKGADWSRVLDAATQRRTEVLAPENLENMWARGRNYKDKLNKSSKKKQAKKGLVKADAAVTYDLEKAASVNKQGNKEVEKKAVVQIPQGSSLNSDAKSKTVDQFHMSQSLGEESTVWEGLHVDNACNDVTNAGVTINRLKRSNSTSSKVEPDEKRPNTYDSKGIIISEFYSSDVGRHSEQRPPIASKPVIHAEPSQTPRLRSRVLGAYFEKIGSNSFAVYSVAVTDSENNTWFVKRRFFAVPCAITCIYILATILQFRLTQRYRNFERLHRHLKDIPNYTLQLPPKRIFSSSTEDAFVHQRCIQLDKYLQDLLSIANVAEQHEVWDFLSESSKNYSFGKSSSVMRTLAVNVDDAVDDIVRQFKGVSDGLMRKVVGGQSPSLAEFSQSMPQSYTSLYADDYKSQSSMQSSIEQTHSSSDDEEVTKDQHLDGFVAEAHGWHSDNELDARDFHPRMSKELKGCKSFESKRKTHTEPFSEPKENRTASTPLIFDPTGEPVAVPPEWTPPNVCVPALNLVDNIFQLKRRGWLRRQVFWISKQILQVVMEDAIDDFLLGQINWLRRDDVIAHGIRWIQDVLWPGGHFFLKLELSSGKSDGMQHEGEPSHSQSSRSKGPQSGSFEAQLEAVRRANDVKKLLFNGAPATLVSLIGHKQYNRCARDMYYFLQSTICIKQLAYGGLELVIISLFPELSELLVDIHKNMRTDPT